MTIIISASILLIFFKVERFDKMDIQAKPNIILIFYLTYLFKNVYYYCAKNLLGNNKQTFDVIFIRIVLQFIRIVPRFNNGNFPGLRDMDLQKGNFPFNLLHLFSSALPPSPPLHPLDCCGVISLVQVLLYTKLANILDINLFIMVITECMLDGRK